MSNFSKIVIIILLLLSFFFIREKYGSNIEAFISSIGTMPKVELPKNNEEKSEPVKKPTVEPVKQPQTVEKQLANVYFLALDSDDNGIYKKVSREITTKETKLEFAIKELLKGPNLVEKSMGAYSEIPKTTKLLGIKTSGNKVIIDLSSDFQYGGGTDSVYSRMMQLIKTAINNTDKKVYLHLDGKQVNIIGGEGIMISQPLSEKSLEN